MPHLENQLVLNRCPHCKVDTPSLQMIAQFETRDYISQNLRNWKSYKCSRCGGVILAAAQGKSTWISEMYPNEITVSEAIPIRAQEYLKQALNSIHAPAGAIMLASSSIDAMFKYKGYKSGSLYTRINKAEKDHLITEDMSKWAHQVRLDANEQRHVDEEIVLPSEADAKKTIDFTLALGEFLFVLPSKVTKGIEDSKKVQKNPNNGDS